MILSREMIGSNGLFHGIGAFIDYNLLIFKRFILLFIIEWE